MKNSSLKKFIFIFRKEGLVWIIKAIWNLGHKVSPAYLPSCIDEELVSYLFNVVIIFFYFQYN